MAALLSGGSNMAKVSAVSFSDAADILSDSRTKTIHDGENHMIWEAIDQGGNEFIMTANHGGEYLAIYP